MVPVWAAFFHFNRFMCKDYLVLFASDRVHICKIKSKTVKW